MRSVSPTTKRPKLRHIVTAVFAAVVATLLLPHSPADANWPLNGRNCLEGNDKKKKFQQNCTLRTWYAITDGGDAWKSVRLHAGRGFKRSHIEKIYRQQGLEPPKDIKKMDYRKLYGLRDAKGKVLLPTIYKDVRPISTTHSVVELQNGALRIARHGSAELTAFPKGLIARFRINHPTKNARVTQVWFIDKSGAAPRMQQVLPDGTLSAPVENIDPQYRSGATRLAHGLVMHLRDPNTGQATAQIRDVRGNLVETVYNEVKVFDMWQGEKKINSYGKKLKARRMKIPMARVGPAPESLNTYQPGLFWPLDHNGLVERPAHILGMIPVGTMNTDTSPPWTANSWLVAFLSETGVDYALGGDLRSKRPEHVLKNLQSLEIVDDVKLADDAGHIAYKPLPGSGRAPGWYPLSHRLLPQNQQNGLVISIPKNFQQSNVPSFATADEALANEGVVYKQIVARKEANRLAEAEAKKQLANFNRDRAATELAGYQTTYVSDCREIYNITYNSFSAAAQAWKSAYKMSKPYACAHVPKSIAAQRRTYVPTKQQEQFDLGAVFRELGKRAAEAPKYYKCRANSDGRTETCGWTHRP